MAPFAGKLDPYLSVLGSEAYSTCDLSLIPHFCFWLVNVMESTIFCTICSFFVKEIRCSYESANNCFGTG